MPDQTPLPLPLPTETSQINRRRPPQPLPVLSQQHLPQHTCNSADDCAVQKVFETPELLENILSFLPTRTILSSQHVSNPWKALINTSPSLRLHFFLEPQWRRPAIDFKLLPDTIFPGLTIRSGEPVHLGQWIEAQMTPDAARTIANKTSACLCENGRTPRPATLGIEKVGRQQICPSYPLFFITQPPMKGMQAFIVNADFRSNINPLERTGKTSKAAAAEEEETIQPLREKGDLDHLKPILRSHSKLACDAGITLGFMADVANDLLKDWERAGGDLVSGEEQKVVVVFQAIVSFCLQTDAAPRRRSGTRFVTRVD